MNNVIHLHSIARGTVEAGAIGEFIESCEFYFLNPDNLVTEFFVDENVRLLFDGYNQDPREVYQIPEIRRFCDLILANLPVALFCDDRTLKTLALCTVFDICDVAREPGNNKVEVQMNLDKVMGWLIGQLGVINSYVERLHLSQKDYDHAFKRVSDVIKSIGGINFPT